MNTKFVSIFFLVVAYFFSFNKISAVHNPTASVYRLTNGFYREDWPVVHKNTILWVDPRDGGTVYAYNIKQHKEYPFFPGGSPLQGLYGLIGYDGRYILYASYEETDSYDARLYDVLKRKDIAITDEPGTQFPTDFDKGVILYVDGYACGKLFAYSLKDNSKKSLSETACGQAKISKNKVVWAHGSNVYAYDLKTDETVLLTENGFHPDILNNRGVWLNRSGDSTEVHLKNLNSGKEKILHSTKDYEMTYPVISDRYVIWGKTVSKDMAGVEGVDLSTGKVFEIQEQGSHQNGVISPVIDGNVAAWMAWRTGNGDIYGALIQQ